MTTPRRHAITLIPGDGVGPEVALATKRVLDAAAATAGVAFDWEEAEAGAEVVNRDLCMKWDTRRLVRIVNSARAPPSSAPRS